MGLRFYFGRISGQMEKFCVINIRNFLFALDEDALVASLVLKDDIYS
jgi:hypothetical protein